MLNDVLHVLDAGWLTRSCVEREILFPYFGLEAPPLPDPSLHGVWAASGLRCVLVAPGAFYRLAIRGFNAIFIYFFLLDQTLYLNHFCMIAAKADHDGGRLDGSRTRRNATAFPRPELSPTIFPLYSNNRQVTGVDFASEDLSAAKCAAGPKGRPPTPGAGGRRTS